MRIVIDRNTFVRGEAFEADPEPVELEDSLAKELIGLQKAHAVDVAELGESKKEPVDPSALADDEKASRLAEKILARSMVAARKAGSDQAAAFDELGVSILGEDGKPREIQSVAAATMEALAAIADWPQRDRLIVQLFGTSADFIASKLPDAPDKKAE